MLKSALLPIQTLQYVGIFTFSLCSWQSTSFVFIVWHMWQNLGMRSTGSMSPFFMSFAIFSMQCSTIGSNSISCPLLSLMYWLTAGCVMSNSFDMSFCLMPSFSSSFAYFDRIDGITYHTTISQGGFISIIPPFLYDNFFSTSFFLSR